MRKTVIPSKGLFALSIFGVIMDVIIIWTYIKLHFWYIPIGLIDWLLNDPGLLNLFVVLLMIVFCLLILPVMMVVFAFGSWELYILAGRPIKFSDDKISIGYIKKKYYDKKNITGVGIESSLSGRLYTDHKSTAMGIYIAFGDYRKSDFSDYGISNVWEMVEFHKVCPKAVDIDVKIQTKTSQPDLTKIHIFDGLVWMTYTEENFRFLQNWLGSKFDEVTQR